MCTIRNVLRSWVTRVARTRVFSAAVGIADRLGPPRAGLLPVLTYHRVGEPARDPDLDPALISATPRDFAQQIEMLARSFRPVSLREVLAALEGGGPALAPRAVLVTFDDAYEDFASTAWPVLQRLGVPVVLFVPTAYPGDPARAFWWDRLHRALRHAPRGRTLRLDGASWSLDGPARCSAAFRAAARHLASLQHDAALDALEHIAADLESPAAPGRVLGWGALRALAAAGVALAAHSRTHPWLQRMPIDAAVAEAVGSREDLEREIGHAPPCFAYPDGAFGEALPARLAAAGFRAAFTTRRGINDLAAGDPLLLRRINVGRATSEALLRAQLLPWMTMANRFLPVRGTN